MMSHKGSRSEERRTGRPMSELSSSVMDHATDPRNRGPLADADAIGQASVGGSPPFVTVYLKMAGELVARARFEAQGCGYTVACCSILTEIVTGRSVLEMARLTSADILHQLEGVPRHRQFCAALAIEALSDALRRLPGRFSSETC